MVQKNSKKTIDWSIQNGLIFTSDRVTNCSKRDQKITYFPCFSSNKEFRNLHISTKFRSKI